MRLVKPTLLNYVNFLGSTYGGQLESSWYVSMSLIYSLLQITDLLEVT